MKQLASILILLFIYQPVFSQETATNDILGTRYIRDTLYVPLRSGQSEAYRIVHKGLKSGAKLELLEENKESGYSRVKTRRGIEGWIQTQYLVAEPTAALQLTDVQEKLAKLISESQPLKATISKLEKDKQSIEQEAAALRQENEKIRSELTHIKDISENAINLDQNNKALLKKFELLKNEVDILSADNTRLKENSQQEAFINGALAVGFGVLLTLLIPRLVPRKKRHSDWG